VCRRRQRSRATVKERHRRLQDAYRRDARRVGRRTTVLSDRLVHPGPVAVLCARWGRRPAWLYAWPQAWRRRGLDSVGDGHGGARRPPWPPSPPQRLVARRDAGPRGVGCETAGWQAVRRRGRLWRAGGGLANRPSGWTVRHQGGFAFPKARVVSAHLAAARRHAWLQEDWPPRWRAAKRRQGLRRCADAASVAPWGSLRDTWAPRGQPPAVSTRGTRQGLKVWGALDDCSGRLLSPGLAGRCPSDRAHACLTMRMAHPPKPLWLMHEGARSHPRQATPQWLAAPRERRTAYPVPAYAPEDTPRASRWQKTTPRASHHPYCKAWAALTASGDTALASCAPPPATVCGLCGRYGEDSGLELTQAAELSKSKPEHL